MQTGQGLARAPPLVIGNWSLCYSTQRVHGSVRVRCGVERYRPIRSRMLTRFHIGCSKRSRCKAARDGPSEAYSWYAAASARAGQRRRWAFFSSLLEAVGGSLREDALDRQAEVAPADGLQ